MPSPSPDPIRYGLRALDVLARAEASVPAPAPTQDPFFRPNPVLRASSLDGAALSLKLFAADEDATAFVTRAADLLAWRPPPARAAALFEAHAAVLAGEGDDELVVGFPLVSFVQQGQRRTAPLLSWSGARAVWRMDDRAWKLPHGARAGVTLDVPTGLHLAAPVAAGDEASLAPHGGLWSALFDLEASAWADLPRLAGRSAGGLVRAATRLLTLGAEDALDGLAAEDIPLTREDLVALCDAVRARASARYGAQCFPHAMALLLPRGDPTSGLRAELRAMEKERPPAHGPLAVYLGAEPAPSTPISLAACGAAAPTPSQLRAAEVFEGSRDLVAVCGPPGCGKTTLLHHLAAHTIVASALGSAWVHRPGHAPDVWPLVIASTNNTAVDHALAPFVRGRALPVGLRLGNRRAMGESAADAVRETLAALEAPDGPSLPTARAGFEARASALRAHHDAQKNARDEALQRRTERMKLTVRVRELRETLALPQRALPEGLLAKHLRAARHCLQEHAEAITHVAPKCLEGPAGSVEKARARWAEANRRRGPKIEPALLALGLPVPYGPLPTEGVHDALDAQAAAMDDTLTALDACVRAIDAPLMERELDAAVHRLAAIEPSTETSAPPLDPSLVELALGVRDAWARHHRARLLPLLREALGLLGEERRAQAGRPLQRVLASLSALFPVAGCTLLSMRAAFPLESGVIERLVIDEAGQCAPVYAIPALLRAKRALCTGDTAQLPPVYTLSDAVDDRLSAGFAREAVTPFRMATSSLTSAQAVAAMRTDETALVEHFRSQPDIVALASSWSGYHLDVRTLPRSLTAVSPRLSSSVIVEHVAGRGTRAPEGIVNDLEAARALAWVAALLSDGVAPSDLAVLTPFVGQSHRIERALRTQGLTGESGILVKTVHKLQGGERRVVLFSVVATEARHLRWLRERPHLLHVATSRAQDHLVVLVNGSVARSEPALAPLVRWMTRRGDDSIPQR